MKVNSNRDISFKGFYNNKSLKKGLEFAADNGALFAATSTLAFSLCIRPLAISLTPHTDKENKIIACAKSIASSLSGYILMLAMSRNVAKSIELIDKNPKKFLKPETIKILKEESKDLYQSKAYIIATQSFKLGLGLLASIPKAILTCWGLPIVLQKVFHKNTLNDKNHKEKNQSNVEKINFKSTRNENLAKKIGKIIDNPKMQKFANRLKNSNFVMHIVAATDTLTTLTFIHETNRSKKIEEKRKKALCINAAFSTGLSIITSYILDKLTKKPTENFIKKFKEINKNDPNLKKQVEGIKIAKPILLTGCVYYMLIPFVATFLADIADKNPKFDITKKI